MRDGRYVEAGERTTRVSLAIKLVDAVTGKRPVGSPTVRVGNSDADPVVTPSGYRVFLDLDPGTVSVTVDGGTRYLDTRRDSVSVVDVSAPDTDVDPSDPATLPVAEVSLLPSPAYQFPPGTTRVRGHVSDSGGDPVSGAAVSIRGLDYTSETNASGEFALFVPDVTADDVVAEGGRKLVQVEGDDPVIEVEHPSLGTTSDAVAVEEGALTVHHVDYP